MKTAIVWFKTDLRLEDNETLCKAIAQNDKIVPVYCFDSSHYKKLPNGFLKTGAFRAQFLLESLQNLDANLRALGSGLQLVFGNPEEELPKIAHEFRAYKVYAKREVTFEEKQTELKVQNALWKQKCELLTCSTSTLYHAEDLPFSIKDIPDVFTTFRKKTEHDATIRMPFPKPQQIQSPEIPVLEMPNLSYFGLQKMKIDERAVLQFKGGETEGLNRIKHYFFESHAIANYKETRNEMVGANYSSKFSAWLALGCLSPRYIYQELKAYEKAHTANESTYWLVFELLWRDYFRFMMKKHQNKLFLKNGFQKKPILFEKSEEKLHQWIDGKTGVAFVDANMLELKLTGFMSNRGRQNVASYLCNDLQLDWRLGASYFEQQLIDYDPCSNWGNWAYLAGVGNDPRGSRYFNIEKQASDYDKNKVFRHLWIRE